MSAKEELIAAALTAADELDEIAMSFCSSIHPNSDNLREACARAMVQPDMAETEAYEVSTTEVPMQCGWYQDGDEESTTWQTSCGAYFTLNEGTPSDNRFSFCYSCGKHIVEYPIDEDEALRGEVMP